MVRHFHHQKGAGHGQHTRQASDPNAYSKGDVLIHYWESQESRVISGNIGTLEDAALTSGRNIGGNRKSVLGPGGLAPIKSESRRGSQRSNTENPDMNMQFARGKTSKTQVAHYSGSVDPNAFRTSMPNVYAGGLGEDLGIFAKSPQVSLDRSRMSASGKKP